MRNRLSDSDNMAALASRGAIGTAAYVRVHWGQQHADWKSMDTMDGTEITFAFLLEDVARYWGVPADECALCPVGTVSSEDRRTCAVCPPGSFTAERGATACSGTCTLEHVALTALENVHKLESNLDCIIYR